MKPMADILPDGSITATRAVLVGPGCLGQTAVAFRAHFPGAKGAVIADENTYEAAGREVLRILKVDGLSGAEPFVFPGSPRPAADYREVTRLIASLRRHDAVPLAVGSGTLNDLVKRAAFETGRPYMVAATAASVDGYASCGAALSKDGFKQTLPCPAPRVILADTAVLKRAPYEMTAAGFGDLAAKVPAGADWLIASALGADPLDPRGWELVQTGLRGMLEAAAELRRGSAEALKQLFEGLTASGLAMQLVGTSRPASGSEHFFSHIWEMNHLEKNGLPVYHGFMVALGTLTSTALTEALFSRDLSSRDLERALARRPSWAGREREVRAAFRGRPALDRVLAESRAKYLDKKALAVRLRVIAAGWQELRARVSGQLIPFTKLKAMLQAAGCPVRPEEINCTREDWKQTCRLAQMIRRRYTALDLAFDLGRLDECVEEVFAPGRCF
jgi:glycerol-1-phosphate dehydrogenase [NAD(P)+]